jgi:hypothetical protein
MHLTKKLVLQRWCLGLLEVSDFKTLADRLRPLPEGETAEGQTYFVNDLLGLKLGRARLPDDQLRDYDSNIVELTRRYNEHRGEKLVWKYYQWLALLFTEFYLDRFFRDRDALLAELNSELATLNQQLDQLGASKEKLPPFVADDLTKLAFLQATGSGKTLQMHANLLQWLFWREKHAPEQPLDRILLLTPNEGLSNQHLKDFEACGGLFNAELFNKDTPTQRRSGVAVDIIDIHKLGETSKEKTVAVSSFEGNNLVLVDEGHRGASGVDWMERRAALCKNGFSFEYSATFVQAVNAATGAKRKELEALYGRCILFDYGYRWFYGDGFGKDYRILNLDLGLNATLSEQEQRERYLTGCVLSYYQQLRLFHDKTTELKPYHVAQPLLVFVGSKVTKDFNAQEASDIVEAIRFLTRFTHRDGGAVGRINGILDGSMTLHDEKGRSLFHDAFDYLRTLGKDAAALYRDCLELVFHSKGPAILHVALYKGIGEIGLQLGDSKPFGVVRVGDTPKLKKQFEEKNQEELKANATAIVPAVIEQELAHPLFPTLTEREFDTSNPLRVLLGSKMFTEGWSCYRVSTMGFLNIAKSEGSQAIQLFGRGVRLKGFAGKLKRSTHTAVPANQRPKYIQYLERLNIFGLRAGFMAEFKKFLEDEGASPDPDATRVTLPVLASLPNTRKLKTLDLPPGINFKRQGPIPTLSATPHATFKNRQVEVDWYPKAQSMAASGAAFSSAPEHRNTGKLGAVPHLAFLDWDAIYRELLAYKQLHNWNNLNIPQVALEPLLRDATWYVLYIPSADLAFDRFATVQRWQEIATVLLKRYLDRFYTAEKAAWEHGRLIYRDIDLDDVKDRAYTFEIDPTEDVLLEELAELKKAIETGKLASLEALITTPHRFSRSEPIMWGGHLYQPLLHLKKGTYLKYSALALQESEKRFVNDLIASLKKKPAFLTGKELYLLRNESRSRGFGFFEDAGFFPDFLVWLVDDARQTVWFVDPHGMARERPTSLKLRLAQEIRQKHESRLAVANIHLGAAVVTETPYLQTMVAGAGWSPEDCRDRNLYFMDSPSYIGDLLADMTATATTPCPA